MVLAQTQIEQILFSLGKRDYFSKSFFSFWYFLHFLLSNNLVPIIFNSSFIPKHEDLNFNELNCVTINDRYIYISRQQFIGEKILN